MTLRIGGGPGSTQFAAIGLGSDLGDVDQRATKVLRILADKATNTSLAIVVCLCATYPRGPIGTSTIH